MSDQVGLQGIKFAIQWQALARSATPHKSVQEIRRTIEEPLAQAAGPGLKCLYIAARRLYHMDPKPQLVDLTFRGQPLATRAQGDPGEPPQGSFQRSPHESHLETVNEDVGPPQGFLSLNLKHLTRGKSLDKTHSVQVKITVAKVFRAKLTEHTLLLPFGIMMTGTWTDVDETQSAEALMKTIISIVQAVTLGTTFTNEQALTGVVANALFEERGQFADVCHLTRVYLYVSRLDGFPRTYSASEESLRDHAVNHLSPVGGAGEAEQVAPSKQEGLREEDGDRRPAKSLSNTSTLIALGSNVGDRLACIEDACRALDADPDIRVTKTSALYETQAMYVEDQAPFLNGVCEVRRNLL